jgi:peptidyl-prolyl cis-trans isomerase A (cyclophilin A)
MVTQSVEHRYNEELRRLLISIFTAAAPAFLLAQTQASGPTPAPAKPEPGLYATLQTSAGTIRLKLFEAESPITVKNFVDLARGTKVWTDPRIALPVRKPLYDGLTFHRVIPEFMIQGGDPLGNGTGGTAAIPDEFHESLRFDIPGRVAMANSGPNTGSCQFFITEVPTPHLNGKHTIFGQVVEGIEVVRSAARVPARNDKPLTDVKIEKVLITRIPAAAAPKAAAPKIPSKAPAPKRPSTSKSSTTKGQPATRKQ